MSPRCNSRKNQKKPNFPSRAFTLVELLVCIGIIAMMIGILLPALNRARESSHRTACLANLRTLGQAMLMYANDNRDCLPNSNPPHTNNDYAGTNTVLVNLAEKYVRSAATFHCPSDTDPVPTAIETADQTLPNSARVSYDFYSVWWMPEFGPRWVRVKQAPLAWDLDGGEAKPAPDQNHGIIGGNVLYADGHAQWQHQKQWDNSDWPDPASKYYLH